MFDPPPMRRELWKLDAVTVRHHPDSALAALLLIGWLSSRLGWSLQRSQLAAGTGEGTLSGVAHADGRQIELRLKAAPELQVPGLAGVDLCSESGLRMRLDREPGGLRARRHEPDGRERTWTLLGASRGEGGILGEGIRQALLRDRTYGDALEAVRAMLPERAPA